MAHAEGRSSALETAARHRSVTNSVQILTLDGPNPDSFQR
jgi:hypothetical protein